MRSLAGRGAVVATGALLAIGTLTGSVSAQPQLSEQDSAYLQAAHQSNLAEIATGQLAQSKGASQQVKDIGGLLVTDHTALDQVVQQLASAAGVQLPGEPNDKQKALQARLQSASGGDFDAVFIDGQMQSHAETMQLGRTEVNTGSSPDVKKAATDAAPVIESHHEQLTAAAQQLGLPTSIDTGNAGLADTAPSGVAVGGLVLVGVVLIGAGALGLRRRVHA